MANFTFFSLVQEELAIEFKSKMIKKNFDKKTLREYAVVFYNICLKKGLEDCLFPDYLVQYCLQE